MATVTFNIPFPTNLPRGGEPNWRLNVPRTVELGYGTSVVPDAQLYSIRNVKIAGLAGSDGSLLVRFADPRIAEVFPPGITLDEHGFLTFDPNRFVHELDAPLYCCSMANVKNKVTIIFDLENELDRGTVIEETFPTRVSTCIDIRVQIGLDEVSLAAMFPGNFDGQPRALPFMDAIFYRFTQRSSFPFFEFKPRAFHATDDPRSTGLFDALCIGGTTSVQPGARALRLTDDALLSTHFAYRAAVFDMDDALASYRPAAHGDAWHMNFVPHALAMRAHGGWSFLFLVPRIVRVKPRKTRWWHKYAHGDMHPLYFAIPVHVADSELMDRPGPQWPALGRKLSMQVNCITRLSAAMSHARYTLQSIVKKSLGGLRKVLTVEQVGKLPKGARAYFPKLIRTLRTGESEHTSRLCQRYDGVRKANGAKLYIHSIVELLIMLEEYGLSGMHTGLDLVPDTARVVQSLPPPPRRRLAL